MPNEIDQPSSRSDVSQMHYAAHANHFTRQGLRTSGGVMSSNWVPGLVVATGFWMIVAVGMVGGSPLPRTEIWVSTASEKVSSHPTLVRAADPTMTAATSRKISLNREGHSVRQIII